MQTDIGSIDRIEVREILQRLRTQHVPAAASSSSIGDKLHGKGQQAMSPQAVDAASPTASAGISKGLTQSSPSGSGDADKENVYSDTMNRLTQAASSHSQHAGSGAAPITQF